VRPVDVEAEEVAIGSGSSICGHFTAYDSAVACLISKLGLSVLLSESARAPNNIFEETERLSVSINVNVERDIVRVGFA